MNRKTWIKYYIAIRWVLTIGMGWAISQAATATPLVEPSLVAQQTPDSLLQQNTAYHRLQSMVSIYEAATKHPWPVLPRQVTLKINMTHPIIPLLRERLCKTHDLSADECTNHPVFDKSVEKAVRLFQERHGLNPDGIVGEATRAALNVSPAKRLRQINVNLARWAHLIKQANPRYIWINIPDYRLRLVDNHQAIMTLRVIVGKPSRKTPEIHSAITRIVLNPYWYVPPGIRRRDVIPKAIANPAYLRQQRIRIFSTTQPNKELYVNQINWSEVKNNPARYVFRQDPGAHNALGQIKFEFNNPHLVYLHDTPAKELFDEEKRLFSSGCIRMKEPFVFLSHLMDWDERLSKQKQQVNNALLGGRTTIIQPGHPIPIHITYITAWVDKNNVLHFWDDVYQHDQQITIQPNNQQRDLPQPV
jgi:murein L,D-transpeptidase YcbB/YkuD